MIPTNVGQWRRCSRDLSDAALTSEAQSEISTFNSFMNVIPDQAQDSMCSFLLETQNEKRTSVTRGHSTLHAGRVLGLQTTVLVLDPPKLVCRDLFGSYNWGLKGFYFGEH